MLHVFRPRRFAADSKSQACQDLKTKPPANPLPPCTLLAQANRRSPRRVNIGSRAS
jgi:hypothetical protein